MGGSYGGYATLVGLTFTPDVFACGVDIVGPSNLVTLLKTIPPYWVPFMPVFKVRVGDDSDRGRPQAADERSPLTYVDKIKKPLLIGQGANDPRVKQAEADQIVKAMQAKNIPVTYVLYPDEGHGFARPENSLSFNAVPRRSSRTCLGGRVRADRRRLRGLVDHGADRRGAVAGVAGGTGDCGRAALEQQQRRGDTAAGGLMRRALLIVIVGLTARGLRLSADPNRWISSRHPSRPLARVSRAALRT